MHIDFNSIFSGFAGVIVGAFVTTIVSYLFQRRLLDKQLAAADKSQKVFTDFLTEFRNMLNDRLYDDRRNDKAKRQDIRAATNLKAMKAE